MNTITVSAIYRHGVLELKQPLDVPENTEVIVQVAVQGQVEPKESFAFGAFPELTAITDEELEDVKKVWDRMADKQNRKITES
jgi:predicted DNA-binding antitoxin AbrB/MazE fold protein